MDAVSLALRGGEWAALVGPNGAGKSTLLRCWPACATPTAGGVRPGRPRRCRTGRRASARSSWPGCRSRARPTATSPRATSCAWAGCRGTALFGAPDAGDEAAVDAAMAETACARVRRAPAERALRRRAPARAAGARAGRRRAGAAARRADDAPGRAAPAWRCCAAWPARARARRRGAVGAARRDAGAGGRPRAGDGPRPRWWPTARPPTPALRAALVAVFGAAFSIECVSLAGRAALGRAAGALGRRRQNKGQPMGPQRIVCLTEETTEWLYLLGEEARIVGISGYTVRPRRARQEKPRVVGLPGRQDRPHRRAAARPGDRLLRHAGRAGRQADPRRAQCVHHQPAQRGRDLRHAAAGGRAWWARHERAEAWIAACQARHAEIAAAAATWPRRPRVYFEEWDEPMISAIRWVSELVGIAGGDDIFPELALQSLGRDRIDRRSTGAGAPRGRTSSSVPGAARSSGPRRWPLARGGRTCPQYGPATCTKSSPATSCSPVRPR